MVVYKCECLCCGKFYSGNTQNQVKKKMTLHFNDTKNLINKEATLDSFAKYFASHLKINGGEVKNSEEDKISVNQVRKLTKTTVLWSKKPISTMKTFKKIKL